MNPLEGYSVIVECRVQWGEMDAMGHVNNAVYFRYFENARLEYFRRIGWLDYQRDHGIGPILASIEARFRKPVVYPDNLKVGTRISSIADDRFVMDYAIWSERLGLVACEGKGTVVSFCYPEGRKAPIPEPIRQRIAEIEKT